VIKGAAPVKRSKDERRQTAAAKGSLEAAQLVASAEATSEDLENDLLMNEADLEDSDADSELEGEGGGELEGSGGNNGAAATNAGKAKASGSALAGLEIGDGDHDEFTEVSPRRPTRRTQLKGPSGIAANSDGHY
jgi:regulator of protease activity HflC (stomatin/prohibitin superfamily)